MLLSVGYDPFAGHLSLEASDCAFDAFVIVNLYLCHSRPPYAINERKAYTTNAASVNLSPEGREQKAEGRRQKAEGRRQKAEGRKQKAESRRKYSFAKGPDWIFHFGFAISQLSFQLSVAIR